jgi:hypothetical protein
MHVSIIGKKGSGSLGTRMCQHVRHHPRPQAEARAALGTRLPHRPNASTDPLPWERIAQFLGEQFYLSKYCIMNAKRHSIYLTNYIGLSQDYLSNPRSYSKARN